MRSGKFQLTLAADFDLLPHLAVVDGLALCRVALPNKCVVRGAVIRLVSRSSDETTLNLP